MTGYIIIERQNPITCICLTLLAKSLSNAVTLDNGHGYAIVAYNKLDNMQSNIFTKNASSTNASDLMEKHI